MKTDPIEQMQAGWKAELPDMDTSAMATVARLNRFTGLLRKRTEVRIAESGATVGEFDVLSALRRQGPPYRLKPSSLARATMLSPSGMTHRLDQLEKAGLVERVADPSSRRTAPVALTIAGVESSGLLAKAIIDVEEEALAALSSKERQQLDALLTKAIAGLAGATD